MRTPGEPVTALTERTFTDRALDSRTGLMYYRARWYDPRLGRFIQADTVVPGAGNLQALNRYAYVLGNSLRYVNLTGNFSEDRRIKLYLQNEYGEKWERHFNVWKSDAIFREMLLLADYALQLVGKRAFWCPSDGCGTIPDESCGLWQ